MSTYGAIVGNVHCQEELPEDIEVNLGLKPCALPYTMDHEHIDIDA